jgi:hypothetical protein
MGFTEFTLLAADNKLQDIPEMSRKAAILS